MKEKEIEKWINKISTPNKKLNGHSICPFAKTSTYKIIECSIEDIKPLDDLYGVVIFIIEDNIPYEHILHKINELNKKYPQYIFFEDLKSKNTFINKIRTNNGKYNLILYQDLNFLRKIRKLLARTSYYKFWDDDYLKKIVGKDYNNIQKIKNK